MKGFSVPLVALALLLPMVQVQGLAPVETGGPRAWAAPAAPEPFHVPLERRLADPGPEPVPLQPGAYGVAPAAPPARGGPQPEGDAPLNDKELSYVSSWSSCTKPPAERDFDTFDDVLTPWITYGPVTGPFTVSYKWWWSEAGYVQTNTFTQTASSGHWCTWLHADLNGGIFPTRPGSYYLDIYFDGNFKGWIQFSIWPKPVALGTFGSSWGDGKSTFQPSDGVVRAYAKLQNYGWGYHDVQFKWYRPGGAFHANGAYFNDFAPGYEWHMEDSISIGGTGMASYPGTWTLRMFVDGNQPLNAVTTRTFTLNVPPGAPGSPSASQGSGAGQIALSWSSPSSPGSGVSGYKVYLGTCSGCETYWASTASTGYVASGLAHCTTYHARVLAYGPGGDGPLTSSVNAKTACPPGAPQSPSASRGPGAGQVTVSWSAPSSNGGLAVQGYRVYRSTSSSGPFSEVAQPSSSPYVDGGLAACTSYFYQVGATNPAGTGASSSTASAVSPCAPSAPQNPSTSMGPGQGQIRVSWSAPSDSGGVAVSAYRVYRSDASGGPYALLAQVSSSPYTDSGLPDDAVRWYRVSAVNAVGEGAQSAAVSGTTPGKPGAPAALAGAPGPAAGDGTLVWAQPVSNGGLAITSYRVLRSLAPGGPYAEVAVVPATPGLTHTDHGLALGRTYYYVVLAENAAGPGPASGEASILGTAP